MATSTLRPPSQDSAPTLSAVPDTQQESLGLSAPRHILTGLLCLLAGGGVTAGAVSHGVSKAEVDQAVSASQEVSRLYTDAQATRLRDERKAEQAAVSALLAEQLRSLTLGNARLEAKVDVLGANVGALQIDVATIKARGGR
jgi:hypothetical protein